MCVCFNALGLFFACGLVERVINGAVDPERFRDEA